MYKRLVSILHIQLILILLVKVAYVLFNEVSLHYPDEYYYLKISTSLTNDGSYFSSSKLPVHNWGYISLNAILNTISPKAIYILNIVLCYCIKLRFLNLFFSQGRSYGICCLYIFWFRLLFFF